MVFYAIAKILEYQDRRREERRRRQEEAYEEGFNKGLREGIALVLNSRELAQYPELRERIRKYVEDAIEEKGPIRCLRLPVIPAKRTYHTLIRCKSSGDMATKPI